eukprot:350628-Chlamydomonas_euryale.AAC.6
MGIDVTAKGHDDRALSTSEARMYNASHTGFGWWLAVFSADQLADKRGSLLCQDETHGHCGRLVPL